MKFPVSLRAGTIKQYNRNTLLTRLTKVIIISFLIFLCLFLLYKLIPNPYLCYGYKPVKIGKNPIEFDWTRKSYQCRFSIANSGILTLRNPILHLYFIDGATVSFDPQNREWQKNDDVNYFWAKNIDIHGGIHKHKHDYAERAWPIDAIFHKKGINRVKYIIISNGIQKNGEIKVINKY